MSLALAPLSRHPALQRLVVGLALAGTLGGASAQACSSHSAATSPVVLELYTSEGCSSCPPADRWLSGQIGRPGVVALAFHVDYWDRLGWVDRYASADHTRRQMAQVASSGARFAYTPQLIVQGQDWPRWPGALPAPTPSLFDVSLTREGRQIAARIQPLQTLPAGATRPAQVAAYWAWTEDGHQSAVRSGENAGRALRHDAVVRAYASLPAWRASESRVIDWQPPVAEKPGRAVLVITDAMTHRPLQALALGC